MQVQQTVAQTAATGRVGLAVRLVRLAGETWRLMKNRHAMRRLDELTDWELRDIGLTREDVARAQEGPILDDPIRRLMRVRQDRERAESAMRRRA
ncbi:MULTISPECIES: DUF1127 domain-containing protein [Phyllobacteriaceae]|uniref:DUF1127 domain-containing protein n=1 Tax=Phyllobacteriaceae TaxID=69277 RepID=UPI002ACA48D2|nr:DUF1127 domain-containing protein [Chelativorans sp. M5D2P16]MDZ5700073.1 DUF1127 domain-containing protein [Chelativorans sp. M5D2P16]